MYCESLDDRMKEYYENRAKTYLLRRTPVIIRVDGRAFHTLTKHFQKPFDINFAATMWYTMETLCKEISGCVFGYTQSDEITLILCDYQTKQTDAFFDYGVQKICSVAASIATLSFNKYLREAVDKYLKSNVYVNHYWEEVVEQYANALRIAVEKGATFDARCFNIPKEEVVNNIIWRQNDASKNSVQMLARSLFPHKELQKLNTNQLQDKMMIEKGINWNDLEIWKKRGACCYRKDGKWYLDKAMPIISQDKYFIEKLINFEEV